MKELAKTNIYEGKQLLINCLDYILDCVRLATHTFAKGCDVSSREILKDTTLSNIVKTLINWFKKC